MMRFPDWLKPDQATPEHRAYEISRHEWLASVCDTTFRIVEMTLILGAVKFLEERYHGDGLTSRLLSAFLFVFIRSKLLSGLYAAIDNHSLSERNKRLLYWSFWGFTIAVWLIAWFAVEAVLPIIVAHEAQ